MSGTSTTVTYEGIKYPSISALARAYNLDPRTLHNRMSSGHTLDEAITLQPFQSLRIIKERTEWMEKLGWSVSGLCTSAIWAQWVEVLKKLHGDFTAAGIAALVGVNHRTILRDLKQCGIEVRPKGGANYRGKEFHRRVDRANLQHVQLA